MSGDPVATPGHRPGDVLARDRLDDNGATRTVPAVVAASAMLATNSKNCVACTIEYGIRDFSISCSWAVFARK